MNEHNLKIGDVVWRMTGRHLNPDDPVQWFAEPLCIEYMDEHKFLSGHRTGGSWGLIGKTYFLSREEALAYWQAHREEYDRPALTSAMFHQQPRLGSIVKDDTYFLKGEDILRIYQNGRPVQYSELEWATDDRNGEYGLPPEYITLGMIREQLGNGILTVWEEQPTHGSIYQTGNYPPETAWRLHGHTMGYA